MVDAMDLDSIGETHVGSIPISSTMEVSMELRDFRGHDLEPGDRVVFCQNNVLCFGVIQRQLEEKIAYDFRRKHSIRIYIKTEKGTKIVRNMNQICKVPL